MALSHARVDLNLLLDEISQRLAQDGNEELANRQDASGTAVGQATLRGPAPLYLRRKGLQWRRDSVESALKNRQASRPMSAKPDVVC